MPPRFDVVIVGGGVTGLTTALALAHLTSLRIALLESSPQRTRKDQHTDGRVSALSPASQRIFEHLGVWEKMWGEKDEKSEISAFHHMQVWNATGEATLTFDATELGVPVLGYIAANQLLEAYLADALAYSPKVHTLYGVKPKTLTFHPEYAEIQTEAGEEITARLVVGADGAHSQMRILAGLTQSVRAYGHTALVAEVETEYPHKATARQCFLREGPLAFLPLSSPFRSSIVWSLIPEKAAEMAALDDADFCSALAAAFQHRCGQISHVQNRGVFPLMMRHAKQYVRDHFALVGDAAHTIHPLAGQGMNLGLLDAAFLAETIAVALREGRDFAGWHALRRYERARKTDTALMLASMDFFRQVPAHPHPLVQKIWQTGLHGVSRFPIVRHFLAGFALGTGRGLPALALSAAGDAD